MGLKPSNFQQQAKNSPEWQPSPDGARSVDATQSSQPHFKSSISQSSLMPIAKPSGEDLASPQNQSASGDQLPALEPATETLVVHSSKMSTVSTTLSETPHGEHHHATHLHTQPSTPRTPLLPTGSNNKWPKWNFKLQRLKFSLNHTIKFESRLTFL